ncbi:uncharacterized protein LAESUDRAFT_725384 [Laetiporus sulphureus 93-53]|uniref:Zn(2)-C6 fungal-type domain-containing protein n=1 Tax=Laetiporus sulphureus 93-53 TaxID=1314785 RepID=A0A165EH31_9APHY|nr:uncharacterized protein LAESUDRAFT_725384 [Laetiporus sulphureus 93-53]KZT07039.1 hypothetical protein LAESUDRAFT_725384 [Laetiporus sulphureus 93-53]
MASEQNKSANSGGHEQPPPHPMVSYPPQHFGSSYVPPGPYPSIYTYAPVPDGNHDPNIPGGAPPPAPYFMAIAPPPPGMVYAYPAPPPGYPPYVPPMQAPPPQRPKRKQVKMACTNCASACKRCDEARPCERCRKYNIADSCVDGVRKERKKGIKRGPYKRKNRNPGTEQAAGGYSSPPAGEGDQPAAPVPYPVPPEGYYSYYYPHGYMPPTHDGQPHPEGVPNGNGQHIPHPPYIPVPMYAPFPPYSGAPMPYPPPPMPTPAPASNAAPITNGRADPPSHNEANGDSASTKNKKRVRAKNGDDGTKSRRTKHVPTDSQPDGDIGRGKNVSLNGQSEAGGVFNGMETRTVVAV